MRYLLIYFGLFWCIQYTYAQKVVVLKDGSAIKAKVIEDTDEYITFIISSGDTLTLGYKYVQKKMHLTEYNLKYPINNILNTEKFHKTTGVFVNLDLLAFPISLAIGKRIDSSLNFGGIISVGADDFSTIIGVGPYVQKFFGTSIHHSRIYAKGYGGIGIRDDDFFGGNLNKYPFFGGGSIGVQIPNKKKVKFYFELGFYTIYSKRTSFLNDFNRTQISEKEINFSPQVTLLGLQF